MHTNDLLDNLLDWDFPEQERQQSELEPAALRVERPCMALLLLSKFGLGLSTVHNATQYLISFVKQ